MTIVAVILSLLVAALGALGIVAPGRLVELGRAVLTPAGLYVAAAFRVILGLVLFVAAPDSRAPDAIRIFGVIIIVHGLATPFVGVERSRKLLDLWTRRGSLFMRLWGCVACGLGVWLAYTVAG